MTELYPWFVFLHLIGLVIFAVCHGVSMFVAFRVRANRHVRPAVVAAMEASSASIVPMYIGLLLLVVGGLGAALGADLLTEPWVLASIVVLVVVIGAMYGVATTFYKRLRLAVGMPAQGTMPTEPPIGDDELAQLLDNRRPELLLAIGGIGMVVLLWLMVMKPG